MNEEEIKLAIEDVKKLCDLKMERYEMVSLRSALDELGINPEPVIKYVAAHGFNYCADHTIQSYDREGAVRPSQEVCYWVQISSRVDWSVSPNVYCC
jgi:hypothetical protein